MSADVQLVKDLVARFPILEDSYESHVFNMDGVLPHVYLYEVSQEVVQSFVSQDPDALDWRAVLAFLEEQLNRGVLAVSEVIVTSFLWYMPNPGEPGYEIVSHLGPTMSRKFHDVRPGG